MCVTRAIIVVVNIYIYCLLLYIAGGAQLHGSAQAAQPGELQHHIMPDVGEQPVERGKCRARIITYTIVVVVASTPHPNYALATTQLYIHALSNISPFIYGCIIGKGASRGLTARRYLALARDANLNYPITLISLSSIYYTAISPHTVKTFAREWRRCDSYMRMIYYFELN